MSRYSSASLLQSEAGSIGIRIPYPQVTGLLAMCLLFAGAFYQAPLFSSNQNTYFLQGLAQAGYGHLSADWLANQTDLITLFSSMVALVHAHCGDWMFHVLFLVLATTYAASLCAIVAYVFGAQWRWTQTTLFLFLLTLLHCAWVLTPIADVFPALRYGVQLIQKIAGLSVNGVAGQTILRPIFQPSTFGVLILTGMACFLYRHELACVLCILLAAAIHPTFILHAGIVTATCMLILISERQTGKAIAMGFFAVLLVLPVLMHIASVVQSTSPALHAEAQDILVNERIPHHAKIATWFSISAVLKIAIIAAGVAVSFRNKRAFLFLLICALTSILLSLLQWVTGSASLALLFPWRLSTWLVPASMAILVGDGVILIVRLLEVKVPAAKQQLVRTSIVGVSIALIASISFLGAKKTIDGGLATPPYDVASYAKAHALAGQTYLIPLKYENFRLAAGMPVFIDWKSHPFRDEEVMEWHNRILLARAFYRAKTSDGAAQALAAIEAHAAITHIIVKAGQEYLFDAAQVEPLFKDDNYVLVKLR